MHHTSDAPGESARAPADTAAFVYVDTAFGGVDRRNKPRALANVRLNGVADCYVSHNRATDALVAWVATHANDKGNPTVAGFDGPTWAPDLHLDFDSQDDPGIALGWLRGVLDRLESWGADLRAVRIYFSGNKGFHLEIPHTLFGGFAPAEDLHARMKRAATRILGDIPFDAAVYDRLRLWRLPNSKSGKTGLHKIRLTHTEARTLDLAAIRELAARPRDAVGELEPIPDDEWMPVDELVAIWDATVEAAAPERRAAPQAIKDEARDNLTTAMIAASWPHGGRNTAEGNSDQRVSRHADYLLSIIGYLGRRAPADQVRAIVEAAAEQAGDPSFLHEREWRSEIRRIVDGTAARIAAGATVTGLPSLGEKFPALASVLPALWPDAVLFTFDDDWFGSHGAPETPAPNGTAHHDEPRDEGAHATTNGSSRAHSRALPAQGDPDDDQEGEDFSRFSRFSRSGFPTECLPGVARRYVEAAGRVIGAPDGYVALPLLVYAGGTLGNEHRIEIGEFAERPVLFGGVIGEPGSAKSPANRAARHPVDVLQAEAYERYTNALTAFDRDLRDWEALSKGDQQDVAKPIKPVMAHFFTTNATLEALTAIVRDSRGLAVAPDELVAVITSMDAYRAGKGSDRQSYLSLWDGAPLKVDRKGQEPIYVPHPVVGVVGGIQPAVLQDLAKGGRRDGFIDRFVWVADASPPPDWTDDVIGDALKAEITDVFRQLRDSTADHPVVVSAEARARWRRWFNSNQRTVAASAGLVRGIYAKLPRQLLRIALILHALTHPKAPADTIVSDETMADAIEVTEYFRQSANRVAAAFGSEKGTAAGGIPDRIMRFLRTADDWVSRSDIRDHFGRHITSDDVGLALAELEAAGLAETQRRAPASGKGRPAEVWRAVPPEPMREKREKRDKSPDQEGAVGGEPARELRENCAGIRAESHDEAPRAEHATESAPACPSCRRTLGLDELPCMACKDDWQCRACRSKERRYRPQHGDYVCAGERCGVNAPRPHVSEVTA